MKYSLHKSDLGTNMAPLIDVVFLLLIFFIVASTLNMNEVQTQISLPETEVVKEKADSNIVIMINKEKEVYLNEEKTTIDHLEQQLAGLLGDNKNPVSIYADKKIDYQYIIRVMDIIKKLKVEELSFSLLKR